MLNLIADYEMQTKIKNLKLSVVPYLSASNRIKKQSGYFANTIHSLLEFDGNSYKRNSKTR